LDADDGHHAQFGRTRQRKPSPAVALRGRRVPWRDEEATRGRDQWRSIPDLLELLIGERPPRVHRPESGAATAGQATVSTERESSQEGAAGP